jgi:hypothetical protein
MTEFNGSSMGLAVMMGELRAEFRHLTDTQGQVIRAIERQNAILLDLPSRLSTAIVTPQTHSPRVLPEVSELIRALYPVLILLAALAGKAALPETGLLSAVVGAMVHGTSP